MSDEELIARLRKADEYEPLGHDGWEAADRIEALVKERDRRTEMHECAMSERDDATLYADEQKTRAERLEAQLAAAVEVLEFYARSERDDAGLLAETVLAKIKGADHE